MNNLSSHTIWLTTFFYVLLALLVLSSCNPDIFNARTVDTVNAPIYQGDSLDLTFDAFPYPITGRLPQRDFESFHLVVDVPSGRLSDEQSVVNFVTEFSDIIGFNPESSRLHFSGSTQLPSINESIVEDSIDTRVARSINELNQRFGSVNSETNIVLQARGQRLKAQGRQREIIYAFQQSDAENIPIENAGLIVVVRTGDEPVLVSGRLLLSFDTDIDISNSITFDEGNLINGISTQLPLTINEISIKDDSLRVVVLPLGQDFIYSFKLKLVIDGNTYQAWVNVQNGEIAQLLPLFSFATTQESKGMVVNPSPTSSNELIFQVDSNSPLMLSLDNEITVVNANGLNCSLSLSSDESIPDFSRGVDSGTCTQVELNVFAWVSFLKKVYTDYGSGDFRRVLVRVNDNSPCAPTNGNDVRLRNQACADYAMTYNRFFGTSESGSSDEDVYALELGVGNRASGPLDSCPVSNVLHNNAALDGTVIAHEFGHLLNHVLFQNPAERIVYIPGAVSSFSFPIEVPSVPQEALNEGLADFWSHLHFNTNVMGEYWNKECEPVQGGGAPRRADLKDVFPDIRFDPLSQDIDTPQLNGQVVSWGLWSLKKEFQEGWNDNLDITKDEIYINLIPALQVSGFQNDVGKEPPFIHQSIYNILEKISFRYQYHSEQACQEFLLEYSPEDAEIACNTYSSYIHKILAGFARAGIFLNERVAIVDSESDFLDRNSRLSPKFTVWAGRDYTFSGLTVSQLSDADVYGFSYELIFSKDPDFDNENIINRISKSGVGLFDDKDGFVSEIQLDSGEWDSIKNEPIVYYKVIIKSSSFSDGCDSTYDYDSASLSVISQHCDVHFRDLPPQYLLING